MESAQGHGDMKGVYVKIWVALAVFTAVEVGVTYTALAKVLQALVIGALSLGKVLLVALFFMHLRYESKWFRYLALFSLGLGVLLFTFMAHA